MMKIKSNWLITSTITVFMALVFLIPAHKATASYMDELIAGAKKEGKFVMYSTSTVEVGQHTDGQKFKEAFPWLEVEEVLMASGSKLLERMYLEIQAGRTPDIAHLGSGQMGSLRKKGLLMKYHSPQEKMFSPGYEIKHGFWTPIAYGSLHSVYNTKLVKPNQLPLGYDALLDPKWQGQSGIDIGGTFWQFWTAMDVRYGRERGDAFMQNYGNNKPRPYFSNSQIRNLVAAGELTFGIYIYLDNIIFMQKQGAPIGIWNADPVGIHPSVASIMKNSPHPNAAKLFIEWRLGPEAQLWHAKEQVRLPVRRDVDNPYPQYFQNVPFVVAGPDQTEPRLERQRKEYKKYFRVKPQRKKKRK